MELRLASALELGFVEDTGAIQYNKCSTINSDQSEHCYMYSSPAVKQIHREMISLEN